MTNARKWRVDRRAEHNKEKSYSEAWLQNRFVRHITGLEKIITEVDRGSGKTDAMSCTFADKPIISIYEFKAVQHLLPAIKQLCRQSGHLKWVVAPAAKKPLSAKLREWFAVEGIGLLSWYGPLCDDLGVKQVVVDGVNVPGGFNVVIEPTLQKMGKKAYERALAHFKEVENEVR